MEVTNLGPVGAQIDGMDLKSILDDQEIISEIWKDAFVGDRTIDVHVRKIREKIGSHHIKTIKGVGYKFDI